MTGSEATFPHNLQDWSELWRAKQAARAGVHDASYWNARAKTYASKDTPNSYTARFLELAHLSPKATVLDMGCGTGNLTIPLARAGHHVVAADFSSGMLDKLKQAVAEEGVQDNVSVMQLSWDDDWRAAGLEEDQFDACFASRSIATDNLLDALTKLNGVARTRICITLPFGASPRTDDRMLQAIGFDVQPSYDSAYAVALLSGMGQLPHLEYIPTTRNDVFPSRKDAFERYHQMACDYARSSNEKMPEDELDARVRAWLDENLVPAPDDSGAWTLATPRDSYWAFISWNKRSQA